MHLDNELSFSKPEYCLSDCTALDPLQCVVSRNPALITEEGQELCDCPVCHSQDGPSENV